MTTFAAVLADLLRRDPGRPVVTFYDHASGERVELSVATYANWVAKTSSLLVEEFDAERGGSIRIDLPTHWLGPVFLGAAWTVGLVVSFEDDVDLVVCGPDTLARWQAHPAAIACSLRPMGTRFADPLPPGVHDFGVEVWSQPDAFVPWDPPGPDDLAVLGRSQGELLAGSGGQDPGCRLLTAANPVTPEGIETFVGPLLVGGSTVWVRHPDPEAWQRTYDDERATADQPARS
ncbi:TIGR03089 family protein [Nocardioides sp.]|uniref:TIGR03089 family protein n=1 Tax=Nocardioides sp. TaxID=35761 RepID=UPI003D0ECB65